jgi:hypothetical protein
LTNIATSFVAGGAISKVNSETTGLHPDWCKAIALVYFIEYWSDRDSASVIQAARQRVRDNLEILDGLVPGSATYFNEVSSNFKNYRNFAHYKYDFSQASLYETDP